MFNEEQLAKRRESIGASEITRIIDGKWLDLYNEKMGITPPEDLSKVFPVQLGILTEVFNISFRQDTNPEYFSKGDLTLNKQVIEQGIPFISSAHSKCKFITATPDAFCTIDGEAGVMDCKHTHSNSWGKEKYSSAEDRVLNTYKWQMQQQMLCTGHEVSMISPIYGNTFGDPIIIHRDKKLQEIIIAKASQFWEHIKLKLPPVDTDAVITEQLTVDTYIHITEEDVQASNYWSEWEELTDVWTSTITSKKMNDQAAKALKKLVPYDARTIKANGVQVSRSKNNALSIKVAERL